MINSTWVDAVAQILRTAAEEVICPRFRRLGCGEVSEKSVGELVTVADREAEDRITRALHGLDSSLAVVGEEIAAEDPTILEVLHRGDSCWVLDPLDGTANFVAGSPDYGVQLALIVDGVATASWVLHPESGTMWTAQLGEGAQCDGVRVHSSPGPTDVAALKAAVFTRFMADAERSVYEARPLPVGGASTSAAIDYPAVIEGALDLVIWSRTLPWDHLPGALLLSEAGGWVSRLDGSPYVPTSTGSGLVAARTRAVWELARAHWAGSQRLVEVDTEPNAVGTSPVTNR